MWYPLICPICEGHLSQTGRSLKCPRQHSFDLARKGYANLLLARGRRSSDRGDTKEMLQARRRFLEQGFYAPLVEAINGRLAAATEKLADGRDEAPIYLADLGCGEGYYLHQLWRCLDETLPRLSIRYFGMDVSKEAVRLAAQKHPDFRFVVADAWGKLPFHSSSLHILLNVFAPRNVTEFHRVLAANGVLLVVTPGEDHLAEVRTRFNLLGIESDKQARVVEQFMQAFALSARETITYQVVLDNAALLDLIRMTPNAWHASAQDWHRLESVERVETQVSFCIHCYGSADQRFSR